MSTSVDCQDQEWYSPTERSPGCSGPSFCRPSYNSYSASFLSLFSLDFSVTLRENLQGVEWSSNFFLGEHTSPCLSAPCKFDCESLSYLPIRLSISLLPPSVSPTRYTCIPTNTLRASVQVSYHQVYYCRILNFWNMRVRCVSHCSLNVSPPPPSQLGELRSMSRAAWSVVLSLCAWYHAGLLSGSCHTPWQSYYCDFSCIKGIVQPAVTVWGHKARKMLGKGSNLRWQTLRFVLSITMFCCVLT